MKKFLTWIIITILDWALKKGLVAMKDQLRIRELLSRRKARREAADLALQEYKDLVVEAVESPHLTTEDRDEILMDASRGLLSALDRRMRKP
jgi:hypothetical protein